MISKQCKQMQDSGEKKSFETLSEQQQDKKKSLEKKKVASKFARVPFDKAEITKRVQCRQFEALQ